MGELEGEAKTRRKMKTPRHLSVAKPVRNPKLRVMKKQKSVRGRGVSRCVGKGCVCARAVAIDLALALALLSSSSAQL